MNNFEKGIGEKRWGAKYEEFCTKFQSSVAEKTKIPHHSKGGKQVFIERDDPLFTKSTINLYASHD